MFQAYQTEEGPPECLTLNWGRHKDWWEIQEEMLSGRKGEFKVCALHIVTRRKSWGSEGVGVCNRYRQHANDHIDLLQQRKSTNLCVLMVSVFSFHYFQAFVKEQLFVPFSCNSFYLLSRTAVLFIPFDCFFPLYSLSLLTHLNYKWRGHQKEKLLESLHLSVWNIETPQGSPRKTQIILIFFFHLLSFVYLFPLSSCLQTTSWQSVRWLLKHQLNIKDPAFFKMRPHHLLPHRFWFKILL